MHSFRDYTSSNFAKVLFKLYNQTSSKFDGGDQDQDGVTTSHQQTSAFDHAPCFRAKYPQQDDLLSSLLSSEGSRKAPGACGVFSCSVAIS